MTTAGVMPERLQGVVGGDAALDGDERDDHVGVGRAGGLEADARSGPVAVSGTGTP